MRFETRPTTARASLPPLPLVRLQTRPVGPNGTPRVVGGEVLLLTGLIPNWTASRQVRLTDGVDGRSRSAGRVLLTPATTNAVHDPVGYGRVGNVAGESLQVTRWIFPPQLPTTAPSWRTCPHAIDGGEDIVRVGDGSKWVDHHCLICCFVVGHWNHTVDFDRVH